MRAKPKLLRQAIRNAVPLWEVKLIWKMKHDPVFTEWFFEQTIRGVRKEYKRLRAIKRGN